nr:hypothetical protein BHI3_02760 [Bacteriovorax sp. HI3]
MKVVLALCLSLFTFFSSAAFACTDFTGRYKNEQNEIYTVSQSACASVTVTGSDGSDTIITDGQFRLSEENEDVRVFTAAAFIGVNLTLNHRIEYKKPLPPEVPPTAIPVKILEVYVKDARGNVVLTTTIFNSTGGVLASMTSLHQRI